MTNSKSLLFLVALVALVSVLVYSATAAKSRAAGSTTAHPGHKSTTAKSGGTTATTTTKKSASTTHHGGKKTTAHPMTDEESTTTPKPGAKTTVSSSSSSRPGGYDDEDPDDEVMKTLTHDKMKERDLLDKIFESFNNWEAWLKQHKFKSLNKYKLYELSVLIKRMAKEYIAKPFTVYSRHVPPGAI